MGWPQPHLFRQVSCSIYSNLLSCFSYSLSPWLPFLFFFFFFYLVSLLADLLAWWWILCMAIVIPLLADKVRLILLGYRRPRICSSSPVCPLWLDCPQAYTRSEQQACPNMKSEAPGNFHICPLLGVGFSHCFSKILFRFSLPGASLF